MKYLTTFQLLVEINLINVNIAIPCNTWLNLFFFDSEWPKMDLKHILKASITDKKSFFSNFWDRELKSGIQLPVLVYEVYGSRRTC